MSRILVIDDSALMRRLLRQHLEAAGHEVFDWLPLSAMEIPDYLAAHPVDLVLTDFQMPGVNGLTVAKMAMRAVPDVPVVVLTSQRDPEAEAQLLKFKVRRVVQKPLAPEALAALVRELVPLS